MTYIISYIIIICYMFKMIQFFIYFDLPSVSQKGTWKEPCGEDFFAALLAFYFYADSIYNNYQKYPKTQKAPVNLISLEL